MDSSDSINYGIVVDNETLLSEKVKKAVSLLIFRSSLIRVNSLRMLENGSKSCLQKLIELYLEQRNIEIKK